MQLITTNESKTYQFWVASSSFFETSLIFYPSFSNPKAKQPEQYQAEAQLFDSDGSLVNTLQYSFDSQKTSVLELAAMMEGVKYEAGIKHGLLVVKTSPRLDVQCRLHTHSTAAFLGDLKEIPKYDKAFLPLRFSEGTNTLLTLVNMTREVNQIRCKLFLGKRSPEISLAIPKQGVRVLSINSEFNEAFEGKMVYSPGYLRISSKNDLSFAAQVIECLEGAKDESIFTSIL